MVMHLGTALTFIEQRRQALAEEPVRCSRATATGRDNRTARQSGGSYVR
jgi:hypothetical protein